MERYEAPRAEVMDFTKDYVWCSPSIDNHSGGGGGNDVGGESPGLF